MRNTWHFVTSCVSATGEDIDAMNRAAVPVTYRTMLKHVGESFIDLQAQLGYDTRNKRETGLHMKRDWAVGYFKSTYRGRPCYFFRWSHIEHIFQEYELTPSYGRGASKHQALVDSLTKRGIKVVRVDADEFIDGKTRAAVNEIMSRSNS